MVGGLYDDITSTEFRWKVGSRLLDYDPPRVPLVEKNTDSGIRRAKRSFRPAHPGGILKIL